jgi:hypothetical protein
MERLGEFLVQSVEVLCQERDTLAGQVEECDGAGSLSEASDGSSGATVVASLTTSSVSELVGASSSTEAEETPLVSDSSFASQIQHGVASASIRSAMGTEFNWPSSKIAATLLISTSVSTSVSTSTFKEDGAPISTGETAIDSGTMVTGAVTTSTSSGLQSSMSDISGVSILQHGIASGDPDPATASSSAGLMVSSQSVGSEFDWPIPTVCGTLSTGLCCGRCMQWSKGKCARQ